jgi:hypothetical protein
MTTRLLAFPTPFVLIPPTTGTSFPPDFGLLDSEHDESTAPDNIHTVEDTVPCTTQELIGNIGPTAAYSLHALLDNSFVLIFGVASAYVANDTPMFFRHLFSKGAWVVDHALTEIKDKNTRHQSALDGLTPFQLRQH